MTERDRDLDDVLPGPVRRALGAFVIPVGGVLAFALVVWALSNMSSSTTAKGVVADKEGARAVKGVVIENVVSGSPFDGPSHFAMLSESDEIVVVLYEDQEWSGCANEEARRTGAALKPGDKVKAYGSSVGKNAVEVCSGSMSHLTLVGSGSPYVSWKEYADPALGYSFKYPASWTLSTSTIDASNGSVAIRLSGDGGEQGMLVNILEAGDMGVDEWILRYYGESDARRASVEFKNKLAVSYDAGGGASVLLLRHKSKIFQFEYPRAEGRTAALSLTVPSLILGSFEFPIPEEVVIKTLASNSGIEGVATMGPMCPVVQTGGEGCADRPLSAEFTAVDSEGFVRRFSSDQEGKFKVQLRPGTYVVESSVPAGTALSVRPQRQVVVPHGEYAKLDFRIDTGIR